MNTVYVVFGIDMEGFKLGHEELKVFEDRTEAYEYYKSKIESHFIYSFIQTVKIEKKKPRSTEWIQKNT